MPDLAPLSFLRTLEALSPCREEPAQTEALDDLGSRAEVWSFREGDFVRFPDEAPGGPTWVAEGCLVVEEEGTPPRYVGVRESLVAPPGVWIKGQTGGRLVTVSEASWRAWLQSWPEVARRLGEVIPPTLPRAMVQSPLILEPGETPAHLFRKSPLFLLVRAALPSVFFLVFLGFGLVLQWGLQAPVPLWALWLLPGVGMAVTAGLVGLVVWEWRSSVLVVTDRSVIVRQTDVWAHRSDFEKLALERLREAVLTRHGLVDAVLGLVTVELEGDSPRGRLLFRGLPRNSRFLDAMENLRVQRVARTPGRQVIRQALAGRAGGAKAPKLERPAAQQAPGTKAKRFSWRVEKDGRVWFRRHPWLVARRSLPWAGWTALVAFVAAVAVGLWPQGFWTVAGIGALAAALPLGRIGWEFLDWADDRLTLQGDKIVLVHRRPFWGGEVRQEGNLDQVQQVGVRKESLAAMVFDFGTVTISLGAGDPLVFEEASHPEWVQNEIFHHRTLMNQDRERQASQSRLDEVSEILDTWDQAKKAGYFTKESP